MKNAFLEERSTKEALARFILETNRLTMDVKCLEFETAFAAFQGRAHAILFNSGGSANLALIQSLKNLGKLKDRAAVGFSALTWATNVMPLLQLGLRPVPVDCEPLTLNSMSSNLRKTIEEESLDGFFITNAMGFASDLDAIADICEAHGIVLLEDNCEALGTRLPAGLTGNFGLASTFSFFVAHHMSTIEGGMVCTDDDSLAQMLRKTRANGWDRNLTAAQQYELRAGHKIPSEFEAKYTFYDLGYNLRPTEVTGFLGIKQLNLLPENIKTRVSNYLFLEEKVRANPELFTLDRSHIEVLSSFAFPVLPKTPELRSKYMAKFADASVEIRPMIAGNIERQPFFRKYTRKRTALPGADFVHFRGFYCGNYPELTTMDLETLSLCVHP